MFAVIYTFYIKPGKKKEFMEAWHNLTELIYKYEGSLGSRLHVDRDGNYMVYAHWPDEKTWKEAGKKLPKSADKWRAQIRESCERIETSNQPQDDTDVLKSHLYS